MAQDSAHLGRAAVEERMVWTLPIEAQGVCGLGKAPLAGGQYERNPGRTLGVRVWNEPKQKSAVLTSQKASRLMLRVQGSSETDKHTRAECTIQLPVSHGGYGSSSVRCKHTEAPARASASPPTVRHNWLLSHMSASLHPNRTREQTSTFVFYRHSARPQCPTSTPMPSSVAHSLLSSAVGLSQSLLRWRIC
jgi:hypothetical protein